MKKTFRRFFHDSRAVTPVLSNLLLTVVAVAAMSIATAATYVISTNLRDNMSERIITEDLWFNNSTSNIDVYMRNTGKVAVQVSAVYVNNTSRSFDNPFNLEIEEHRMLTIFFNWTSGSLYFIDIVTTRGTHTADYYKAP